MGFELNITNEDVENLVKDTLLKSGLGKAIADAASKILSGYDSPIDRELKRYIGEVAANLIHEKFAEQIKTAVAAIVEARVTEDLIVKMTGEAAARLEKAATESRY